MEWETGKSNMLLRGSHPRHALAAVLAAALSLLLHGFVIQKFPLLPVGKPASVDIARLVKPVTLQGVHREYSAQVERPDVFRPEDPGHAAGQASCGEEAADGFDGMLEVSLAKPPELKVPPLAGEMIAVASLNSAAPRDGWDSRRDIVQIEERQFDDDVCALPRRFMPAIPRVEETVDISWPVDLQDAEIRGREARHAVGEGLEPVGFRYGKLAGEYGFAELGTGGGAEVAGIEAWRESTEFGGEADAEITEVEPVEQLLDLELLIFEPGDEEYVYFQINIKRHGAENLAVIPKHVVLIQDCSESMTDVKLDRCKEGLHRWLAWLGAEDSFNLIGFRDRPYAFSPDWVPVNGLTKARARWFIEEMNARGKTDVYASLQQILQLESDAARPLIAVLVTDGRPTMGLVDNSDIIERFTHANQGGVSVFSVGGGRRVNRFLLDLLSYKNRGDSLVVRDRRDIPEALERWAVQLSRPVLSDLECHFSGLDEAGVYPRSLTHLYLDRSLVIYGRTSSLNAIAFQVVGRAGSKTHDMVFALDADSARTGDEDVRRQWVWHRIYDLIGEHISSRRLEVVREIHEIADRYGLDVPYSRAFGL